MRILFIDDHTLFREAFINVIHQLDETATIINAGCAKDAKRLAEHYRGLDMILLDLALPDGNGVGLLDDLQDLAPTTPIIVLSATEAPSVVRQALESGAAGYIPKSSNSAEASAAIRIVLNGDIYIPPALLASLDSLGETPAESDDYDDDHRSSSVNEPTNNGGLTPREFSVLGLLDLTNKQIARRLSIEEGTVKIYVCNILRKLNVSNRRQAIMEALRREMLSPA